MKTSVVVIVFLTLILQATSLLHNTGCNNNEKPSDEIENQDTKIENEPPNQLSEIRDKLWETSIAIADGIESESEYTAAFIIITENLAIAGRYETALDAADKINNSFYRVGLLVNTANLLIIDEKFELADSTLEQAIRSSDNIRNLLDKASAISAISASYKFRGNDEKSKELDDQKERIMSEVRENFTFDGIEPDKISEVVQQIELSIEDAMRHSDIAEFVEAIDLVMIYDSRAAAAAAMSYVALCADTVDFDLTDELHESIDKIQQKEF